MEAGYQPIRIAGPLHEAKTNVPIRPAAEADRFEAARTTRNKKYLRT